MNEIVQQWTLINESYFKSYSPLPENYNLKEIWPYVHIAEKLWVEPVLGTPLYEELLEQVNNNEVTELNSTLLLNVYPYLCHATVYEGLPFLSYHVSQVGITKGFSENSTGITEKEVNYINTHIRSQVEVMKKLLKKFLDEHHDLYPLYPYDKSNCDCDCECDDDNLWILQYYGGMDKYNWEKFRNMCRIKRDKPNSHIQLYATPRRNNDIV